MSEFDLTPRQIVAELDKFIVGQHQAKRAVAIALRNRFRRAKLPPHLREEVLPKNILMIGPTGVGKTEIARRLARLVQAPFVKVEATKYTEVGYVGRDVESMIRDLVETAIRMVKSERMHEVEPRARIAAEERLLDLLAPAARHRPAMRNPLEALFGGATPYEQPEPDPSTREAEARRRDMERRLAAGEMEETLVEVDLEESAAPPMMEQMMGPGMEQMGDLLGSLMPKRRRRRKVTVAEARQLLTQEEASKLIDMDSVSAEAIHRAEISGMVFIDEIDKVAGREGAHGPDVSREGVQRDLLPIVEGSTIQTKYGPVRTDHILFIAAGAFHIAKPSDLIPELQGRFPIRVELESLTEQDFVRILTEPENALTRQYAALLAVDGVSIHFTDDGIREIARLAAQVNETTENIGARRLHTVLEKLLEQLAFEAPDAAPSKVVIDQRYVAGKLAEVVANQDISRFIL
ncbi:MAG: ATP-dependent protease ATPase subunit HslU [Bacillota bacterium]